MLYICGNALDNHDPKLPSNANERTPPPNVDDEEAAPSKIPLSLNILLFSAWSRLFFTTLNRAPENIKIKTKTGFRIYASYALYIYITCIMEMMKM